MNWQNTVTVNVGDVIDLTDSDVLLGKNGIPDLRAIVRSRKMYPMITIFADGKYKDLRIARVTKINYATCYATTGRVFTNVHVELEDAFGEKPTLIATTSAKHASAAQSKPTGGGEWKRPEFQ